MKSYIIRIELIGSKPLIWRKIIMPAGSTFNKLHETIQGVTNFQSGYLSESYHLFEFDLGDTIVTNSEEAYLEHQHYKKNKKMYEDRLKTLPEEILEFEIYHQERIKIETRKPTTVKIDKHLERDKEIKYNYDFGDDWEILILLEEIVDDYYFGYPTLLDGRETAPPEDVGGLHGFYEFLKIYNDEKHPENKNIKEWAKSQYFREYDPDYINSVLKQLKYKKTEWNNINHIRYKIIDDKYIIHFGI